MGSDHRHRVGARQRNTPSVYGGDRLLAFGRYGVLRICIWVDLGSGILFVFFAVQIVLRDFAMASA